MSISTEIGRIEAAKSDIAAAISGKGVSVPANTKIDGMASLIGQIQTGSGGGGSGVPTTIVAGDTVVVASGGYTMATSSSLAAGDLEVTVPKTGNYRIKYSTAHDNNRNPTSRIYRNGTAIGSQYSTLGEISYDTDLNQGDVISIRVGGGSYSYYTHAFGLRLCIDWENGF